VIERFFLKHIAKGQPFDGLREKIYRLDDRDGQVQFLQLLQDELLLNKLKKYGDDRALVFRYIKGKLQAKRRSISSPEYKYY